MNILCSHLCPLFLGFTVMADMLCPLLSAYLRLLLEFAALLSTLTPQSSHHLLITDVFKHCPMSSTSGGDWTCHLVYHVASLVSPRQPGYSTAAQRPKFCCCCCCWQTNRSALAATLTAVYVQTLQYQLMLLHALSKQDYFSRRLDSKTG